MLRAFARVRGATHAKALSAEAEADIPNHATRMKQG